MSKHFEKHIPVQSDKTPALDFLHSNTCLSKQKLKKTMYNGAVWLETSTGITRLRRAKKNLSSGDILHIYYDEKTQSEKSPVATLIADEKDYSIWNKPAGMFSQGSKWGDHCTIYRYVETNLQPQRPAFLVHRLDRAANGLIIIAHKKTIAAYFSQQFKQRLIEKKYRAVVNGIVQAKTLPLLLNNNLDNKEAVSEILSCDTNTDAQTSTLEIKIQTGRKHQIRRHLASIHHAIVGDRLYGSDACAEKNTAAPCPDLQLSSVYLSFTCPLTKQQKKYQLL